MQTEATSPTQQTSSLLKIQLWKLACFDYQSYLAGIWESYEQQSGGSVQVTWSGTQHMSSFQKCEAFFKAALKASLC